jgi:hypothetical protein
MDGARYDDVDIRLEDKILETVLYKEDHLHHFARKHPRLRLVIIRKSQLKTILK